MGRDLKKRFTEFCGSVKLVPGTLAAPARHKERSGPSPVGDHWPITSESKVVRAQITQDHSVEDSLDQIATWNGGMLRAEDLMGTIRARMAKQDAVFKKLDVAKKAT